MSKAVATKSENATKIEQVLIGGDLSGLTVAERVSYYNSVCESVGLNPLTKPFDYIKLNGKLVLYAKKDATEQLRQIYGVSVTDLKREVIAGDLLHITAYGETQTGKKDVGTGVVSIAGKKGEDLANAYMKCETKAKRRLTLSICGLGVLDESEIETATRDVNPSKASAVNALLNEPSGEIELEVEDAPPAESEPEPDFDPQPEMEDLGEYVIPIGQRYKGKRLKDLSVTTIDGYAKWVDDTVKSKSSETVAFLKVARAYLAGLK